MRYLEVFITTQMSVKWILELKVITKIGIYIDQAFVTCMLMQCWNAGAFIGFGRKTFDIVKYG